jgi:hypothetical protein
MYYFKKFALLIQYIFVFYIIFNILIYKNFYQLI